MRYIEIDNVLFVKYVDNDNELRLVNISDLFKFVESDLSDFEEKETLPLLCILKDLKERKLIPAND